MTEIDRAKRMSNCQLYHELVHCTDKMDVPDEVVSLIEEAAQRLLDIGDCDASRTADCNVHA